MLVFVLHKDGSPLMPCKPAKARHLIKAGKARVVMVRPFTIRLTFETDKNIQGVYLAQTPGLTQGVAAVREDGKILLTAEVMCRKDVSRNLLKKRVIERVGDIEKHAIESPGSTTEKRKKAGFPLL